MVVIFSVILEVGVFMVEEVLFFILVIFFLAGLIEVVFGILWLGWYIWYIFYLVVFGFMSGIGVIIIIM